MRQLNDAIRQPITVQQNVYTEGPAAIAEGWPNTG
jgi:hypothetical protein